MGSVIGSVGGATMLSMGLGMPALFALIGVPAVIAGVSMFSLGMVRRAPVVGKLAVE
jgi:AAHS family 4-hydroxybenzoate transporter-like MFS transporter